MISVNKFFKNLILNEYLEKPFLDAKENKKQDLSRTREPEDLMDSLAFASEDTFISMNSNRGWQDYISIWRRLFAHNIEVEEAVTEIVNEAIVTEAEGLVVKIDWRDSDKVDKKKREAIEKEWHYLYDLMNFDENCTNYFQRWYIDAVLVAELVYDNNKQSEGIKFIDLLEPKNLVLDRDTKTKKQVLRRVQENSSFYMAKSSDRVWKEEQFAIAHSGLFDPDLKIYLSYLNYGVRPCNQLNSIENSLIVYALTRSTEKLVYYIDVGDLNHAKALAKIQDVARQYSSKLKYDSDTGGVLNVKDKIKLSKEIFLGTRGGERGTTVDTISSDQLNLGELPILEYFQDKLYRALKVPRLRRKEETMMQFGESSEVERQEINFFKFIIKLRNKFNGFFRDLLMKHCVAKEIITQEEWKKDFNREIIFKYANNNNYEEMKRIAQLKSKLELLDMVKDYSIKNEQGEIILFSMDYIKKNIMKLTNEEIKQLADQIDSDMKSFKPTSDGVADEEPTTKEFNNYGEGEFDEFGDSDKDEIFEELSDGELAVNIAIEDYEKMIGVMKEGDELIPVDNQGKPLGVNLEFKNGKLIKK